MNRALGDYVTYTANERRYIKRMPLFYGFFRYSLRTLFHTLPVRHPVAMSVAGKLGQLQVEEAKELLGGDTAPWAYGRVFFEGKNGQLKSIDLARANPILNPLVEAAREGPKAIGLAAMQPVVGAVVNQWYDKDLFTGRGFRVKDSASYAKPEQLDLRTRGRIVADDLLSLAYPYRLAKKTGIPGLEPPQVGTQGDEALLSSPRPLKFETREAQEREHRRRASRSRPGRQALEDTFPLFFPKPDNTRELIAERRERNRPKDPWRMPGRPRPSFVPRAPRPESLSAW